MKSLTLRRRKFVAAHAAGMTLTDAAVLAGYSTSIASKYGSLLMKDPDVAAAYDAERARLAADSDVVKRYSLARVMEDIDAGIEVARASNDAATMAELVRTRLELLGMVSQ
jgi:phage terminase small subunit